MNVAGVAVQVLVEPARLLHVALHAAQHGPGNPRPLHDLNRAVERIGVDVWQETAGLAELLDATATLMVGLRLLPNGEVLVQKLGLSGAPTTEVLLRSSNPPPLALGFNWMSKVPGLHRKIGFAVAKAFPPPEFIRSNDPLAQGGVWQLARGYLRRVWWLIRNAPRGLKAFRRARADEYRSKRR
jgi:hypothetical protein